MKTGVLIIKAVRLGEWIDGRDGCALLQIIDLGDEKIIGQALSLSSC
jgi:hypothetical protein